MKIYLSPGLKAQAQPSRSLELEQILYILDAITSFTAWVVQQKDYPYSLEPSSAQWLDAAHSVTAYANQYDMKELTQVEMLETRPVYYIEESNVINQVIFYSIHY